MAADPHLRPYLAITQDQVAGLLGALFRWVMWTPDEFPPVLDPKDVDGQCLRAYRDLLNVRRELEYPLHQPPPSPPDAVFDAAEQDELSYYKHVNGFERLGRTGLVRLLRAVDRNASTARPLEVAPPSTSVGFCRAVHAYNVTVGFRDRPLTVAQFDREQAAVIDETIQRRQGRR